MSTDCSCTFHHALLNYQFTFLLVALIFVLRRAISGENSKHSKLFYIGNETLNMEWSFNPLPQTRTYPLEEFFIAQL